MPTLVTDLAKDLRYTARQLRRAPFFSLTVLLTLALSVGATAAITGVLRATLLHPLPYPQPQQLVEIRDHNLKNFTTNGLVTVARTEDLRTLEHNGRHVFSSLGYAYFENSALAWPGHPTPVTAATAAVSGDFFRTSGVAPLLGRTLTHADDVVNGPQLVVLSHRLWTSAFAADPAILGRTVRLGADQATVIGVMPARFDLPSGTDLWHPGHVLPANFGGYRGDGSRFVRVLARLAPDTTLASANTATSLLGAQLATAHPDTDAAWSFTLTDLRTSLFGDLRRALLLLAAAVALVLLVAAVNIAGLQLSRNAARAPEFSIRGALGVSRARLIRQLMTESTLLTLAGSLAGIALAAVLLHLLSARLPLALLQIDTPHLDPVTLLSSVALALAVGLLTGLLPALQATRVPSLGGQSLNAASNRSTSARTRTAGRTFAVAQVALALVLLTLSAAVLENLYALLNTRLGFDPTHLTTFRVDLPWGYDQTKEHHLYQQLEASLATEPGISAVGSISALPLTSFSVRRTFDIAGEAPTPHHDAVVAEGRDLSPGYAPAMHIPLLAGRLFTQGDAEPNTPSHILINQALANRYFSGRNPIGQRLTYPVGIAGTTLATSEIVGVLGDVRGTAGATLASPLQPEVYTPESGNWPHMEFALRSPLAASTLEPQIRRLLTSLDTSVSFSHLSTLSAELDHSTAQPRLNAALLTSFAALSLLLVVLGIYGLVAFDVAQRTRELALRLALGSTRRGILTLVLGESTRILALGLLLGLLASWAATRLAASLVISNPTHTAALSLVTAALLSLAVFAATLIPARRAASVEPTTAFRAE